MKTEAVGGYGYDLKPDHPDYRAPQSKDVAIISACQSMCDTEGVSMERALEAASDAGFKVHSEDA